MDNRERFAPIPLTGKQPIAELIVHCLLAGSLLFQPFDDFLFGFFNTKPIQKVTVNGFAFTSIGLSVKIFGRLNRTDNI
jgi:hypothetical protein